MLLAITHEVWLSFVKQDYIANLKWVLLEIKPPPDVQKSPKIAENIYAAIHSMYIAPLSWKKRFFQGAVQPWLSLEIVGAGGDIKFYIRAIEGYRNMIETAVFAQYPEAEIKPVEDYVLNLPKYLPNDEYDLLGTELLLAKDDAYPLKTYPFFEEESGKDEFKRTDPLAPLAEVLGTLEPGENIWVHILIRGTGGDWVKTGQSVIKKIAGMEEEAKREGLYKLFDSVDNLIFPPPPTTEKKEKKEFSSTRLTPGERTQIEQIENKISKLGFKSGMRVLYMARKDHFRGSNFSAAMSVFKQIYANNLNAFKFNMEHATFPRGYLSGLFPSEKGFRLAQQTYSMKYDLFQRARNRVFPERFFILNTEELATLFHLPGIGVKAPAMPRVEAKRGTPPSGLPGIGG